MARGQWGVVVRSLDTGELLYERNGRKLMMPASNMKIVTLAGALKVLNWDSRFVTTLETSAPIEGGALRGDLVIRGGGDPTINTRDGRGARVFAEWAAALKAAGITTIDGRIIGDDDRFDDEVLGAGWAWDYLQYGYAAPIGALQYNENAADLTVTPGPAAGEPAVARLSPGSGLTLTSKALTSVPGVPETIDYRRAADRPVLEVFGTVPLPAPVASPPTSERTVSRQVAVVNPTAFFVQSLKDALMLEGIRVAGEAADLDDVRRDSAAAPVSDAERRVLARTESPPLAEIATVMMKVSQNLYAETLLKATAAAAGGLGTIDGGRAIALSRLREWQIDEGSLVMVDGSGLSRYNYVTAELLTTLLTRLYADPVHRDPFMATLAVAGRDGTVQARMRRTRAESNARVKTGSISNVRTLSGYVRTRDGEMLAFSILANGFAVPAVTVNWISDLAVEVLANFTRR